MDTKESRGDDAPAPAVTKTTTAARVPHWSPISGLRARRAASYRLPPLDCGHRDPLDCPRSSVLIPDDLALEVDYWHESWADRGVPERVARGRELAAAGWRP